jgi:transposase-like protein
MQYPKNQLEFEKYFNSEQKCVEYLINIKWPDSYICSNCGWHQYWLITRRRIRCSKCKNTIPITSGTFFEKSNKPLMLWFRAIWWMIAQKSGVSATGLQSILGIGSYKTAWIWLHKLRELTVFPDRSKLSGNIEIDETYIGGERSGKTGRGAKGKSLVVIAVEIMEQGTGRIRMQKIANAESKSLISFIEDNIEKGSEITTYGWRGYARLATKEYKHKVNRMIIATDDDEMLPNAHRVAALLKRWLLGTHQNYVSDERLQRYLDEFTFRYNRRKSMSRGLLFYRIISRAMEHGPISSEEVINNAKETRKN